MRDVAIFICLPADLTFEEPSGLFEETGSPLRIGVSALTSTKRAGILEELTKSVRNAGAHWIYFHPLCIKWDSGSPLRVDQRGVLNQIEELHTDQSNHSGVFVFCDLRGIG